MNKCVCCKNVKKTKTISVKLTKTKREDAEICEECHTDLKKITGNVF